MSYDSGFEVGEVSVVKLEPASVVVVVNSMLAAGVLIITGRCLARGNCP